MHDFSKATLNKSSSFSPIRVVFNGLYIITCAEKGTGSMQALVTSARSWEKGFPLRQRVVVVLDSICV